MGFAKILDMLLSFPISPLPPSQSLTTPQNLFSNDPSLGKSNENIIVYRVHRKRKTRELKFYHSFQPQSYTFSDTSDFSQNTYGLDLSGT